MKQKENRQIKNRDGERGAAMVMVLLISFLMLTASIGLLLETSMNAANITDSTAEQQAYNAAESGIQSTLDVLRGHSKYQKDSGNLIDFRKAVTLDSSNAPGDDSGDARLSRWMTYDSTYTDRVPFGVAAGSTYAPNSGLAYDVTIVDPDNLGNIISFVTTGTISYTSSVYRYPATGNNYVMIEYTPPTATTTVNATAGAANANFGKFTITKGGTGANLPNNLRFEILLTLTTPAAEGAMRGYIKQGSSENSPVAAIEFDSKAYAVNGSTITLSSKTMNVNGYGTTLINGTMTATEPSRVMVTATGYGPRGAVKKLEAFVQKNFLDGLSAPATLTLIGPAGPGFVFEPGNSARVVYSGQDVAAPDIIIPPVGTSNNANFAIVKTALNDLEKKPGQVVGEAANVTPEMPRWLKTTLNLDTVVQNFRDVAKNSPGSYYANGEQPTSFGNNATAEGITFIDGDVDLDKNGGGILVCTGKLTFHGGTNFNGLIIVTGMGGFYRTGGGGGTVQGNVVVAPYDPNNLGAGFSSPKYGITGGGNSDITYNSSSVANGLVAVSNVVLGVAEK